MFRKNIIKNIVLTIILAIIIISTLPISKGGEPPQIISVTVNRERFYRGFQTIVIVVNVTDDTTPTGELNTLVEITFADGLKISKPLVFLADAKVFDVRIPVPSSAAVGSALLKITVTDKDGMVNSTERKIFILDQEPLLELRREVFVSKYVLEILTNIYEALGVEVSQVKSYLEDAKTSIANGDYQLESLEDVDKAIELYSQSLEKINSGLTLLTEIIGTHARSLFAMNNATGVIKIIENLINVWKAQGIDVSPIESLVESIRNEYSKGLDSFEKGLYIEAESRFKRSIQLASSTIDVALSIIANKTELLFEIEKLWNMYFKIKSAYIEALDYVLSIKSLGGNTAAVEAELTYVNDILERVFNALSEGKITGVKEVLEEVNKRIDSTKRSALNIAKNIAEQNIKSANELLSQVNSKIIKPDTSYAEALLSISESTYEGGDYLTSLSYSKQTIMEAARLLKIATDQETLILGAIIIIIVSIVGTFLIIRKRKQ